MSWVLQCVRGAALAGLLGVGMMAVALLTGLTSGTSLLLYPVAAAAAVAYSLIPDRSRAPQITGCLLFGLLALTIALVTGLGALEIAGIVGTLAAATVIWADLAWRRQIPVAGLVAIALVVVVANLVPLTLDGGDLAHDESAYALKARHWIEDTPETGWNIHRGVAMSGYGFLIFEVGGREGALRLLGLASIIGLASAVWVLGNKIGGRWVGPLSAAALVSSPVLLRRSTEYLSDVPSAALLTAVMVVVWKQFAERERPGYGLMWLLPLAWAAFYLRYQSVLSFGLIAITLLVLFWDKVKAGWRPVGLTAALGLVGLIPHFMFATSETGSPLGVLLFTADVAGRDFYGQGLIDYFLLMGWPLAAFVGPAAAVFFIWWLVVGRKDSDQRTRCLFLMIPAVTQVLILGLLSHGEARFIFFPLALTLVGGVTGAMVVVPRWSPVASRAATLALTVLLIGSLAMSAAYVRGAVENRAEATGLIEAAAAEVRESADGSTCGIVTSYFPQVTFYSGCYTEFFRSNLEAEEILERLDGVERYVFVVEEGKNQPVGEELEEILALTTGDPQRVTVGGHFADIYEFGR